MKIPIRFPNPSRSLAIACRLTVAIQGALHGAEPGTSDCVRWTHVPATAGTGVVLFEGVRAGGTYRISAGGIWAQDPHPDFNTGPDGLESFGRMGSGPFAGMLFGTLAVQLPGGSTWIAAGSSATLTAEHDGDLVGIFADVGLAYENNNGLMVVVVAEDPCVPPPRPEAPPVAGGAVQPGVGCVGSAFVLDGSGSFDTDEEGEGIVWYNWHLSNRSQPGNPVAVFEGPEASTVVIFESPGDYTASLVVTDNEGDTAMVEASVRVHGATFDPAELAMTVDGKAMLTVTVIPAESLPDLVLETDDPTVVGVTPVSESAGSATYDVMGSGVGTIGLRAVLAGEACASITVEVREHEEDSCPDDPLKTEPGECGCGVSEVDSDGDGTPDCHDGCPDDPRKTEPGACGCGTADDDADGNGRPDCEDAAAYVATIGDCSTATGIPERVFFCRLGRLEVTARATDAGPEERRTYRLVSSRFPELNAVRNATGTEAVAFTVVYPPAGDDEGPDRLRLEVAPEDGETTTPLFDVDAYPVFVELSPNPDRVPGGRVDLRIDFELNQPDGTVRAEVRPWHEDLRERIEFRFQPRAGQPTVYFEDGRDRPDGPDTLLSPKVSDTSGVGSVDLIAVLEGSCGANTSLERCSNELPIHVWPNAGAGAWVEGRAFGSETLRLPRPVEGVEYSLEFQAQIAGGSDGVIRSFEWAVSGNGGFELRADAGGGSTDHRSTAMGTVSSAVQTEVPYTVTVTISPGELGVGTRSFTQEFVFFGVQVAPRNRPVLAGGLDDDLHRTVLEVQVSDGGSAESDVARMELQTDRDYFVDRPPRVSPGEDGAWAFRSSDLASVDHEKAFRIGAYSEVPLLGEEVEVARTLAGQHPGHFKIEVVQPPDGRIYPNGAVEVRLSHLRTDGTPSNHEVQVRLPPGPAHPAAGTGSAGRGYRVEEEFELRGATTGSSGSLLTLVVKLAPTVSDPGNPIFNQVVLQAEDAQVYDETTREPMRFGQAITLIGAEESFWRRHPLHGRSQRGTFWNWATVVGKEGSGFRNANGQAVSGEFGVSRTAHGTDYETDDRVERLVELRIEFQDLTDACNQLEADWSRWRDKVAVATADYALFKGRFEDFRLLKGVYDSIAGLIRQAKELAKQLKDLRQQQTQERNPKRRIELLAKIASIEKKLGDLEERIRALVERRDRLLDRLGSLNTTAVPDLINLGRTLRDNLDDFDRLRTKTHQLRLDTSRHASALVRFIDQLWTKAGDLTGSTEDPDEALKREYLHPRLEALHEASEALFERIRATEADAARLDAQAVALANRLREADAKVIVEGLRKLLQVALKRIKFGSYVDDLLEWLGIREAQRKLLSLFDEEGLFDVLDALIVTMNDTIAAGRQEVESTRDVGVEAAALVPPTITAYRVWITPTVEFPKSVLEGLKPDPIPAFD